MSCYNEALDFLWAELAGPQDKNATKRRRDYSRKRLQRALLGRQVKPYFLEASWKNTTGAAGEQNTARSSPLTFQSDPRPIIVVDGAIRTTDFIAGRGGLNDKNSFDLLLSRTGGEARVQLSTVPIKDEHLISLSQSALQTINTATRNRGYGATWPLTWPVPLRLRPNELLTINSTVLNPGPGVPAGETTFVQFRCLVIDEHPQDDILVASLRQQIEDNPRQYPVYLHLITAASQATSLGAHSISFTAVGANQRVNAKTREADAHLLVLGYSMLLARDNNSGADGNAADPKWRLQSSDGHAFSKDEIDCNTFAFAGPDRFYQEFPRPFLLTKGNSLSASFSTLNSIGAQDQTENYVIFRCVTV